MSPLKAIAVILILGLVRVLKPLVLIRFGTLFISRLGHLAGNTECYLCEKDEAKRRVLDIWCPQGKPANEQLFKMCRRRLWVSDFGSTILQIAQNLDWFKPHIFGDANWGRDIHNLMEKHPPHLKFTKAEERKGQELLRALGIPEGAQWVCIIARDSMYLRATEPGADYSYHDFRNSDIQNYREAAVMLMERGFYVLRMGRFVEGPMRLQAPKFIDYACHPLRSDFLDVYLGAKCAFAITNGCGFDGIPMIFRKPLLFVNEAPFEYLSTWIPNALAIWKHHVKEGKRMTPSEIVTSGAGLFHLSQQYKDAGITLQENSPAEILEAAQEMLSIIPRTKEEEERQRAFWALFPRSRSPHNGMPLHGEIKLRIGAKFLEGYAH